MFTVQEMIEQFAEEYSLFAEQDARFLTIHSVSQYLDFFFQPIKLIVWAKRESV